MTTFKPITKNALGFVLIDAPNSALNMSDKAVGTRYDNETHVKVIRGRGTPIPYVSAQAWRYWWRNTIETRSDWKMSPVKIGNDIKYTSANPFIYPDDDVFGYMRAITSRNKREDEEQGTLTRLSPLKTSPLISVAPQQPTLDYGVMVRGHEDNPGVHLHQCYSTVFKGIFSLDLSSVGVFGSKARTGYKNLDAKYLATPDIQNAIKESEAEQRDGYWILPRDKRIRRAKETIEALPYLSGGAKSTLHLTDVTPKLVVLAIISGGNHLFMNIAAEKLDGKLINTEALEQVITDYKDSILSDVFIGRQKGFQDELDEDLANLQKRLENIKPLQLSSPKKAIESFVATFDEHMD